MSMNFLDSLNMDEVPADPNDIPPGTYDGHVQRSEYVVNKNNDSLNHVVTYQVGEGEKAGAQRAEWFRLGTEPKDADGNQAEKPEDVASYTPTMSDQNKTWYKKRFVDLGIPEDQVSATKPKDLVGIPVTFGITHKNGYINVSFARRRVEENATPTAGNPWTPNSF